MSGGIFVDQPFHPNLKCIILGLILMLFYWFLPATKNVFMLPAIFIIGYISLAWYDYMYKCSDIMLSGSYVGLNTLDSIFKPQRRTQEDENKIKANNKVNLVQDQEQAYLSRVYLFHVLLVAPIVIYIGYKQKNADPRIFSVLLVLGVLAMTYHSIRLVIPRETSK